MVIIFTASKDFRKFKDILSNLYEDIVFKEIVSVHCKEWECDKNEYAKYADGVISPQKIINSTAIRCYIFEKGKTDHFGHFDIRPFKLENVKNDVVCDAFLPDPHRLGSKKDKIFITCKKSYRADDFGYSVIKTVPYTIADGVLAYCTHATLWIIFRLLSYEFSKEYISLVDLAGDLHRDDDESVATKTVPMLCGNYGYNYFCYEGRLKIKHYQKVDDTIKKLKIKKYVGRNDINRLEDVVGEWHNELSCNDNMEMGYYQKVCDVLTKLKNKKYVSRNDIDIFINRLKRIVSEHKSFFVLPTTYLLTSESLYAYVESEIPVYLTFASNDLKSEYGFDGSEGSHSIVAIGHTMKNGELADFIAHDVSFAPFVKISRKFVDEKLIDSIVIIPPEIKKQYEVARRIVERLLQFYETGLFHKSNKILSKDELVNKIDKYFFRPFLMKSQRLKFWYAKDHYPKYFRDMVAKADFPKYIWTFEIRTREILNNKCIGHIIIDATLDSDTRSGVLINMPDYKMHYQDGERKTLPPQQENEFPLFRAMS